MTWLNRASGFASQMSAGLRRARRLGEFPDFEPDTRRIINAVRPYTMTSVEPLYALIQAVKYVVGSRIEGAIAECGVWRGGSMMAAALTLVAAQETDRELFLYDTFDGMTQPTDLDVDLHGHGAAELVSRGRARGGLAVSEESVRANLARVPYPPAGMHFVRGRVEDTIPATAPERIALLRLDTDWYESTRHEMVHLFPRLSLGGVLIVDDYGHWQGARLAVDEYLSAQTNGLLLNRIDYTGRIGVRR